MRLYIPTLIGCAAATMLATNGLADHEKITIDKKGASVEAKSTADCSHQPLMTSQLLNAPIKDNQGNKLGTIKDVMLDPKSGHARFAIIQLNDNNSYKPVPWTLLNSSADLKAPNTAGFTLNADRAKFDSAHTLNAWPDYNFQTWGPRVYTHYGVNSNVSAGSSGVDVDVQTGSDDWGKYGPLRSNGNPIDNGTAPDGKGTFYNGPHSSQPVVIRD